jgi:hypothetical protein
MVVKINKCNPRISAGVIFDWCRERVEFTTLGLTTPEQGYKAILYNRMSHILDRRRLELLELEDLIEPSEILDFKTGCLSFSLQIAEKPKAESWFEPDVGSIVSQFPQELIKKLSSVLSEHKQHSEVEREFRKLVKQWKEETWHHSFIENIVMNFAYQRIIGMGEKAMPLILRELEQNPDHWFWALRAISGEDPTPPGCTFDHAVEAWLTWGRKKGYI